MCAADRCMQLMVSPQASGGPGTVTEQNPTGRGEEGWSRENFPHGQYHAALTWDSQDTFWGVDVFTDKPPLEHR